MMVGTGIVASLAATALLIGGEGVRQGSVGFIGDTGAAWTRDLDGLPEFTFVAGRARGDAATLQIDVPGREPRECASGAA